MSKPLTWDKSKDNPKHRKNTGGSSKIRSGSFPTPDQMKQRKRSEKFKSASQAIWNQGKGGSGKD